MLLYLEIIGGIKAVFYSLLAVFGGDFFIGNLGFRQDPQQISSSFSKFQE